MLKILFVAGANQKNGVSPVVLNQYESLRESDVSVDIYPIVGKGVLGYLKNLSELRKKSKDYDLIHAHYAFSGYLVSLACLKKPIIVSLMGSDVERSKAVNYITKLFVKCFWVKTVVKSKSMGKKLGSLDYVILANGVDVETFKPIDRNEACQRVGFDSKKKHLLVVADPARKEKNVILAKEVYRLIQERISNVDLHIIYGTTSDNIAQYMNACDALLLTSLWEGSPNVVKEAMACNLPIVSTPVGDVADLISGVDGCFISDWNPQNFADKVCHALDRERTNGRNKLINLGLDSNFVANKLIDLYSEFA